MTNKERDALDEEKIIKAAMLKLEENFWKAIVETKDDMPTLATAAICLKVALKIYKSVLTNDDVESLLSIALETTPPLLEFDLLFKNKVLH
jgi:hypothetical protein